MKKVKNVLEDATYVWEVHQVATDMASAISREHRPALDYRREQDELIADTLRKAIEGAISRDDFGPSLRVLEGRTSLGYHPNDSLVLKLLYYCAGFVYKALLAARADLYYECIREQHVCDAYASPASHIRELWPKVFPKMPRLL